MSAFAASPLDPLHLALSAGFAVMAVRLLAGEIQLGGALAAAFLGAWLGKPAVLLVLGYFAADMAAGGFDTFLGIAKLAGGGLAFALMGCLAWTSFHEA